MNLTDEQRAALDRHWKELFEEPVTTETEMVAYGYFKRGYAAAKNETCKWTTYVDLEGSYWATGCIEVFWEKHNFCPDCGRKIQVVEREKAELESRSREIEADALAEAVSVADAMNVLKRAMREDPSYAWSWQCNLAMASYDEGRTHFQSNMAAARFMRTAFDVDVTKFDEWKSFEWAEIAALDAAGGDTND